jgi:hypothetical protein
MRMAKFFSLQLGQSMANFDDGVTRAIINRRVFFTKIVKNVHRKSTIAGSNLIDNEIIIRKVFEKVL